MPIAKRATQPRAKKFLATVNSNSSRFYFDSGSSSCISFTYTGCGGNGNRFESKSECLASCGPSNGTAKSRPDYVTAFPRKLSDCQLPISAGSCSDQV